ncbi:MAG: squalene/phytoene synthase family protein [Pseudomonadota bacterium]
MTSPASDSLKEIHIRLDQRVRSMDEPRWLSSRYAGLADRTTLIVLYAYYYELARVRIAVTDQTMGQIRFQWWRDALDELGAGKIRQHDVVLALADQIERTRLRLPDLQRLVDRHEAAFLAQNRSEEPEDLLLSIAAGCLNSAWASDETLKTAAMEWAAMRRSETDTQLRPWQNVAANLRPAVAHLRLRHLWKRNPQPSALSVRLSVLMAMLTGRV